MAPPPSSGFAQISWRFTGPGVPRGAVTTLGCVFGAPPEDLATVAENVWIDELQTLYTNQVTLDSIAIKVGPSDLGPTYEFGVSAPGNNSGENGPPNVAVLAVKRVTGVSGRRGGRMYWPCPVESALVSGGSLSEIPQTLYNTRLDLLIQDLVAKDSDPRVFHTDALAPTAVTGFDTQRTLATQRRRLRR